MLKRWSHRIGRISWRLVAKEFLSYLTSVITLDALMVKLEGLFNFDRWAPNHLFPGMASHLRLSYAVISIVSLGLYFFPKWKATHALRAFLGLQGSNELVFVMPSFIINEGLTASKKNLDDTEYAKVVGRDTAFYQHRDIQTIQDALRKNKRLLSAETRFYLDQSVVARGQTDPNPELVDDQVVLCIGSSSSNLLCQWLFRQPPFCEDCIFHNFVKVKDAVYDLATHQGDAGVRLVGNDPDESHYSDEIPRIIEDRECDYGIVIKFTVQDAGDTTYFLCAGLDKDGTSGTLRLLMNHWAYLKKFSEGKDFYILFKQPKGTNAGLRALKAAVRLDRTHTTFITKDIDAAPWR